MFQYSGPGSQQLQILGQVQTTMVYDVNATRYIVACVDGRGTGYADFKKK
jgi:hypothetical protein